jgi:hypothetical protein
LKVIPRTSISLEAMTVGDDPVKEMAEAGIQVSKGLCRGIIKRYVTHPVAILSMRRWHTVSKSPYRFRQEQVGQQAT